MNTPAPDYGEPWSEQYPPHPVTKDKGVYWLNPTQFNRAVACVNACAGMADPEKEIAAMREAIREAVTASSSLLEKGHHDTCGLLNFAGSECDCGHKATEKALAKLQPFIQ